MYKRTKSDSVLKCPYCGKQFCMDNERRSTYRYGFYNRTVCYKCHREFMYINISAKYARDHGISAVYTIEDIEKIARKKMINNSKITIDLGKTL